MPKVLKSPKSILSLCLGLVLGLSTLGATMLSAPPVHADDAAPKDNTCKPGQAFDPQKPCVTNTSPSTPDPAAKTCSGGDCSGLITKYVNPAIRLLSGLVGVAVTISIVVGGIQYASAGGDPSKVVAARNRIRDAVLALLAYLFMFAFLQWLLPGGIV